MMSYKELMEEKDKAEQKAVAFAKKGDKPMKTFWENVSHALENRAKALTVEEA